MFPLQHSWKLFPTKAGLLSAVEYSTRQIEFEVAVVAHMQQDRPEDEDEKVFKNPFEISFQVRNKKRHTCYSAPRYVHDTTTKRRGVNLIFVGEEVGRVKMLHWFRSNNESQERDGESEAPHQLSLDSIKIDQISDTNSAR